MARIIFHANDLGLRGTAQAVYDYAHYAETLLGHRAIVAFPKDAEDNDLAVIAKFTARFETFPYGQFKDLVGSGADLTYFLKYGTRDHLISPDTPSAIHAVFQSFDPHGESYAYVSEWLANYCTGGHYPFVPHVVSLPKGKSLRHKMGIPQEAFVYGRYGGYDTFDLEFVKAQIPKLLEEDKGAWCLFVNTRKFIDHPRAIFLPPITLPQEKSDFIVSCDAMIHARKRGESFGLAICEFLYHNRPVLAWEGGKDRHHCAILRGAPDALYRNGDDFRMKANRIKEHLDYSWSEHIQGFSPQSVMKKFDKVFIERAERPTGKRFFLDIGYRLRKVIRRSV